MALSDTAEYWQDVKRDYPYVGPNFHHIPGADCGHRHLYLAEKLGNVTCYACLKLIKNGYAHGLEEGTYYTKGELKRMRKEQAQQDAKKEFDEKYGLCTCGSRWVIRMNTKTQTEFLGCSQYPKCKCTKTITPPLYNQIIE